MKDEIMDLCNPTCRCKHCTWTMHCCFFLKIIFHNIGNPRYESIVATHIGICGNLFCICGNLFFFIYVCIRYRQINHHGNELAVNESSKNRNNFTYDSSQRHDYKDEEVCLENVHTFNLTSGFASCITNMFVDLRLLMQTLN